MSGGIEHMAHKTVTPQTRGICDRGGAAAITLTSKTASDAINSLIAMAE